MTGSNRETAENYARVIHRLGEWRVAECRDGIQWLLQRRRPGFTGVGTAWDTIHYCVTRKALFRLWTGLTGDGGEWLSNNLPERIGADR